MSNANTPRIEYVDIDEVVTWARNPKIHDTPEIYASVKRHGFVDPLIVNDATGVLVSGHGRLEVLRQAKDLCQPAPKHILVGPKGEWLVPVVRGIHFKTDADAAAYAIATNRITILGGWNEEKLLAMLRQHAETGDVGGTGYTIAAIESLAEKYATPMPVDDAIVDDDIANRRSIQVFMDEQAHEQFNTDVGILQQAYLTSSSQDTILEAVTRQHAKECKEAIANH